MIAKTNHGGKRNDSGMKVTKRKAEVGVPGSIRLTPAQWKLYRAWGGTVRLRKHLNTVKGGIAKNAA